MVKSLKDLLKDKSPESREQIEARAQELTEAEMLQQVRREALATVSPEALAYIESGSKSVDEAASHSLSRVSHHIKHREVGIITAHRGHLSPAENNARNDSLKHDIRKAGYGHIPIRGSYIENKGTPHEKKVRENSFMVVGHAEHKNTGMKKFLMKHGKKYDQESVVHKAHDSEKAHLHTTSGEHEGESMDLGHFHANKVSDYSSALKGKHKSFTFEEYFYITEKSFFVRKEHLFE